jgi:hypothetical protein
MKEGHVGPLLATLRELDSATRARVEAHLATCEACRQLQAAYAQQDRLLSDLPAVPASAGMLARVRGSLAPAAGARQPRRLPGFGLATIILVLLFTFGGSAIAVSAQALPGDFLYPVKRTVEQVTLTILSVPQQAAYEDFLAERRRFEAQQVLQLQRAAPAVEFAGDLQRLDDGGWAVGGIPVALDAQTVEAADLHAGESVQVVGDAYSGELRVRDIRRQPPRRAPAPPVGPTATSSPTPTATSTPMPAATDAPRRVHDTPAPTPTGEPPAAVTPTATPVVEPSETPTLRLPPRTPRLPIPPLSPTPTEPAIRPTPMDTPPPSETRPAPPSPSSTPLGPRPTMVITPMPTRGASDTPPPAPTSLPTVVVTRVGPRPTLPPATVRPGPFPTRRR